MRCKMKCVNVTVGENDVRTFEYAAVMDDANKEWSKWTPFANFKIQVTNPEVVSPKPGSMYYVDVAGVPEPAPAT